MSEIAVGVLFIILLIPAVITLVGLINYRIDGRHVRVYWGPIPVRKIAVDDIRDVKKEHRHMSESWTNTIWMPTIRRNGVTLHRMTGGFKRVVITPEHPEVFINQIKSHRNYRGER